MVSALDLTAIGSPIIFLTVPSPAVWLMDGSAPSPPVSPNLLTPCLTPSSFHGPFEPCAVAPPTSEDHTEGYGESPTFAVRSSGNAQDRRVCLCKRHHDLVLEHSHHQEVLPACVQALSIPPNSPALAITGQLSGCMESPLLGFSWKWTVMCAVFVTAFPLCIMFPRFFGVVRV